MVEIRPAVAADQESVLRFLSGTAGGRRPYDRLFNYSWRRPEWNCGYVLVENGHDVRGYLGHIYSERRIGGRVHRLANQTTWFVSPVWRRYSIDLLHAALAETNAGFTNLSANATVRRILEAYKFRLLDTCKTIVSPHHGAFDRPGVEFQPLTGGESGLDPEVRYILDAHLPLGCKAFHVSKGNVGGLVVVLRRLFKGIPYADVLHASVPPSLFLPLGSYLMPRERVVALGVPRRFLGNGRYVFIGNRRPTYYLAQDIAPRDIDSLFTEYPLLYGSMR